MFSSTRLRLMPYLSGERSTGARSSYRLDVERRARVARPDDHGGGEAADRGIDCAVGVAAVAARARGAARGFDDLSEPTVCPLGGGISREPIVWLGSTPVCDACGSTSLTAVVRADKPES